MNQVKMRLGSAGFDEAGDEHGVLDVPAEFIETDLARLESNRRRSAKTAAVVDDAHGDERRRPPAQRRPGAERLEQPNRAVEKRDRAPVRPRLGPSDKAGVEAVAG